MGFWLATIGRSTMVKITEHSDQVRNLPIVPIDKESNLIELMVRLTLTMTIIVLLGLSDLTSVKGPR